MDELFTGWLDAQDLVAANATLPITLQYSTNAGTAVEYNMVDELVVLGPGVPAAFRGRFSYHEVQFVTMSNLAAAPALASITGLRLMNARERVGAFNSSDPLLNSIYAGMLRTYEGLTAGGISVDCPHRERLGYGGDAHTHLEFALSTFESANFYRKWARDWADVGSWDGSNGDLPHTAPTIDGGGGPAWGGFSIVMPWRLYEVTGDARALAEAYPTMQRFVAFLQANIGGEQQLLVPFGGAWGFLGDWVTPHGNEESGSPESVLFNNCYLAHLLTLIAYAADALGDAGSAASYRAAHAMLSASIHAAFYNASASHYLDSLQTHAVLPLVAGVVPPELAAAVLSSLANEIMVAKSGHLDTGLTGTYLMAKLLSDPAVGRDDLLHVMATQTTAPSYGALLAAGYTTWPEAWPGAASRKHGCLSGYGLWFSQGLLGVRPLRGAPGLHTAVVRPAYCVGGLSAAGGATATPYGAIENSWACDDTHVTHSLVVPTNANALLWLPTADPAQVSEGGRPAASAPGVRFLRAEGNSSSVWLLGSGTFAFELAASA
jgi:alpha-L-rhamnosidase